MKKMPAILANEIAAKTALKSKKVKKNTNNLNDL
jgi:hypothetical protein